MSALDFPTSPNDGDTYEGYVYDAAKGVWQWQTLTPSLVSLTDTDISSPANGEVLEYDGTDWVNAAGFPVSTSQIADGAVTSPKLSDIINIDTALRVNQPGNTYFTNYPMFEVIAKTNNTPKILLESKRSDNSQLTRMEFRNGEVEIVGALSVYGTLSKSSGAFRIDHPLKPETHYLVHSFVESPYADLTYTGASFLVDGKAVINLDQYFGMTEGTFVALCRNVRRFTSNESGFDRIKSSISGNILTIESEDPVSASEVCWQVVGERQDSHIVNTTFTDENGRVVVEPEKVVDEFNEEVA